MSYPPPTGQPQGPEYRYTSSAWPPPPMPPQPTKSSGPGRIVLFVALGIGGLLSAIIGIGALVDDDDKSTSEVTAVTVVSPAAENAEADPDKDLGAGEPGAFCATNRLGKQFERDGVTYTCTGPKPYRWREADPYSEYQRLAPKGSVKLSREDAQARALLGCGQSWAPGTVDAALAEAYASLCKDR